MLNMDETVLFPSPNWFQPSGLAVSNDEWLVYGGPSKSLCVLEPLPPEYDTVIKGQQGYTAHVVNKAHPEKIVCVDICPEWPEKRSVLTGSTDGAVKQWSLEKGPKTFKIKSTHSHEIHSHEKEEVAGVGYCKDGYAVTVGSFGNIVKWDLNSNVAKSFNHVLKSFKPVCMACSPHIHMNVAIGTKQGVVFVLDLNGSPRIIYKVRGQDDEILKVSWCPQYEVAVRKCLKESDKRSAATNRMDKIRKEPESPDTVKQLDERVKNSHTTDQPILINEKSEPVTVESPKEVLDESGIGKTLPDDSFDESIVVEDDTFDIYKEPEIDEFGHKKYQPVDILVKIPEEKVHGDYLTECQKLKDEILKRKTQSEASIEALVDAMEKTKVESAVEASTSKAGASNTECPVEGKITKGEVESSVHIHKHLLATIGKHGSIRVWSKSGKLVGSCAVVSGSVGKTGRGQRPQGNCSTLLWYQPDVLLIADGKNQLLECNPLKIDCKNKLEWRVLHCHHKRGLYVLASGAPRVVPPGGGGGPARAVWSAAQDRSLIAYWPADNTVVHHSTCGGFLYMLEACPYDAKRVAISVGDGAVRVWEADLEEGAASEARARAYWQNVQGKVLTVAWHPSIEGLLAFGTAESRVGVLDTSGKQERPGRVLQPVLNGGVYSLSWGEACDLYACGGGDLVLYRADKPDQAPESIAVELEGVKWEVSAVRCSARGLLAGSSAGAVAVLTATAPHTVIAATFVFNKMIHTMEFHPAETSSGEAAPEFRDLLAVCSLDRANTIVILQYGNKEDGGKQLTVWKTLSGHTSSVLQVMWSPHQDGQLMSTSHDGTIRIWDVSAGACAAIFGGHAQAALSATWCAAPALASRLLSGGADCSLRLWDLNDHPPEKFEETKHEVSVDKKKKKTKKEKKPEDESSLEAEDQAVVFDSKTKQSSKRFLLPLMYKQTQPCLIAGPRKMLQKYLEKTADVVRTENGEEYGIDYIKVFGNINEVNEVLDMEMERHEDTGNTESWATLGIVRGYVDAVLARAALRDCLDPFLLTVAPSVSFKYWKDATLMYLQQIDRLVAKGEDSKLCDHKYYGGPVYRKTIVLLSLHDVKAAVNTLIEARLYKEAYVLSRTRYMDSLAEQTLRLWAHECVLASLYNLAAVCYIALGDLSQAATALGKSSDEESLSLAADIAKVLGQTTFAGHIEEKRELIKTKKEALKEDKTEDLKELPSRTELAMQEVSAAAKLEELERADDEDHTLTEELPGKTPREIDATDPEEIQEIPEDSSDNTEATSENLEASPKKAELSPDVDKTESSLKKKEVIENKPEETENAQQSTNITEELLEKLPGKMEALMKDTVRNGTHKGDGDTIQNGDLTGDKEVSAIALDNGKEPQGKCAI